MKKTIQAYAASLSKTLLKHREAVALTANGVAGALAVVGLAGPAADLVPASTGQAWLVVGGALGVTVNALDLLRAPNAERTPLAAFKAWCQGTSPATVINKTARLLLEDSGGDARARAYLVSALASLPAKSLSALSDRLAGAGIALGLGGDHAARLKATDAVVLKLVREMLVDELAPVPAPGGYQAEINPLNLRRLVAGAHQEREANTHEWDIALER